MGTFNFLSLCIVTILFTPFLTHAANYKDGDKVPLYVNKVGPYYNPQETYHYYSLPVCRPNKVEHRSLTLGEVLDGDRMAVAMHEINFKQPVDNKALCNVELQAKDIDQLREAIEDLYYFEFVLDDLPLRGFIGHFEESGLLPHSHKSKVFLWAHLNFNIEFNGDQIISANVSTANHKPVSLDDVQLPLKVQFTYSVMWSSTKLKPKGAGNFFPKSLEIHWLSIINSMVLVFLLIGFVVIILHVKGSTLHGAESDKGEIYDIST